MKNNLKNRINILFGIALFIQVDSNCQTIFFAESKVIDKTIPRTSNSFQERFVRIMGSDTTYFKDKFHMTSFWQPISNDLIIGSKGWMCGKVNLLDQTVDTLFYNKDYEIISLTANFQKTILLVAHNEWIENEKYEHDLISHYNSLTNYLEYLLIDNITKHIDTLDFFDNRKIIPISISSDGRYLAAYSYMQNDEKCDKFYLGIYDFKTNKLNKIDSADISKNEWFGDIYNKSVGHWNNSDSEFYFSKKYNEKDLWTIYCYSVQGNSIQELINFPANNNLVFYVWNKNYYILNQERVIVVNSDNIEKIIYQRKYKYDYINPPLILFNK